MEDKMKKATHYELNGDGTKITFDIEGDWELLYGDRNFPDQEIARIITDFGLIVSVILESVPDWRQITLSLIVPTVNVPKNYKSVDVKTIALKTMSQTSIGGLDLVEGQIQTYEPIQLEGNAW